MTYTLPVASDNTLGGVKIGEYLNITEDGVLNVDLTKVNAGIEESANKLKEGKTSLSSQLTAKGIPTTSDETLAEMSTKISELNTTRIGMSTFPLSSRQIYTCIKMTVTISSYKEVSI